MSLLNLTIKHGRSLDDARSQLNKTVQEAQTRFGSLIQRVEWSAGRERVKLAGMGFEIEMWVDAVEVHLTGDVPWLGELIGRPVLKALEAVVRDNFPKQLPA
jgi:hypothetical protein